MTRNVARIIEIRNTISLGKLQVYKKNTLFTEIGQETVDWINNSHLRRVLTDMVRSAPVQ